MDEHTAETHNRNLTPNTVILVTKICKHVSQRSLDAVEIFITTVIYFCVCGKLSLFAQSKICGSL